MKKSKRFLCIVLCIAVCLVSAIATRTIATAGGNVKIENLEVISDSGYTLAMDLYAPKAATTETKFPCVVVMHGGNNAKEQVNHWCVELARRGYVVVNADMYGHGESERLPDATWLSAGRGLYDAIKYAATIPYVDAERIGVLGYSRGGRASGECMVLDNAAETPLMRAIYIVHSDPVYKLDGEYADVYGSRDVGVDADLYDEFFFSEKAEVSGTTYNAEANRYATSSTTPAEYIINASAQSFLHFGEDPATTSDDMRVAETIYSKECEGGTGTRVINVTNETHMRPWFSNLVTTNILTFFGRTLPTGTALAPTQHIFDLYFICSFVGLMALLVLVIQVAITLIEKTKFFAPIKLDEPVMITGVDKKGKAWFWLLQIICAAAGVGVIWVMDKMKLSTFWDTIFRSSTPTFHGILSLLCGAYTILAAFIWYKAYGKKNGFSIKNNGFATSWNVIGKSFLAAMIAVGAMMVMIFAADFFLKTNYMFVYWGFMAFDADRLVHMLIAMPLFVIFYTIMSFSVNCFNYNDIFGKKTWVSTAVLAFFASLPTMFVIQYVYIVYVATNWNPNFAGQASAPTWIIALPFLIFTLMIMVRKIFKMTGNPYLAGFIAGLIGTVAAWTVAEIRIPAAGAPFVPNTTVTIMLVVGYLLTIGLFIFFRKEAKKA